VANNGNGKGVEWVEEVGRRARRIKAAYPSRTPWKARYYRIRIDVDAELDLEDVVSWYEETHPALVTPLLREVSDVLWSLRTSPSSFPVMSSLPAELAVRHLPLREFPYEIVYVQMQAEVRIIALAHRRRRRKAQLPISRAGLAAIEDWLNRQGVRAPERLRS
jgi:hypothetical protein